jgi:tetrapyrrole methylase family protein / MazG family protein
VDGSSPSLDALLGAAGVDPGAGLQFVDAARLATVAFDPALPLIILPAAVTPTETQPLPGRHARRTPIGVLGALYPRHHPLRSLPDGREYRLLDLSEEALAVGTWLVPPLSAVDNFASPHAMAAISARLRAPDGCPWDRRQDHRSLRPYLLEEAYEAVDAIERGDPAELAEELGDLYLQVVLHAQFAAEEGQFDLTDVYRSIASKIVRRHPHVFGEVTVSGVEQVAANWETIKAGERSEAGSERSAFAGVARAIPALPASREIQERAASLGWDWPAIDGVWDKVAEEIAELRAVAGEDAPAQQRLHEVGDVLFALVNIARWLKVDPEEALRAANRRWITRYESVEALAAERGLDLAELDAEGKDRLWDEVKGR